MLGMTRYQWTVLFAAWLGWGFDSLLFNYVAPNCVPTLLGLTIGSPEAKQATLYWTGILTSVLLLGWAAGGILFGWVCDRIGRTRTLLLTIPAAKLLGRRAMFAIYFAASAAAIFAAFGLDLPGETRLYMYFAIGLSVFGVFGSFTYYLPELFPTRLRGTGAGFCYNAGRVFAAAGPFLVGIIAAQGVDAAVGVLFWVGVVPLAALLMMPWVVETKGQRLAD